MQAQMKGFSLIELMIVVAVIGILAVIVTNASSNSAEKTRLASVKTVMVEIQNKQERAAINQRKYVGLTDLGYSSPLFVNAEGNSSAQAQAYYRIEMAVPDDYKYTITATPINAQAGNACGALTVNNKGEKTATGNNCW